MVDLVCKQLAQLSFSWHMLRCGSLKHLGSCQLPEYMDLLLCIAKDYFKQLAMLSFSWHMLRCGSLKQLAQLSIT